MVKDDFGEGVPVAWLIANKEDVCSLDPFFASLKKRVGNIQVKDFMSDDAESFYNAWCRNFLVPNRQLICSWHVDKNLRTNIMQKIKNPEDQITVYKYVKVLQTETNEKEFKTMLQEMCSFLEDSYPLFYEYFKKEFLQRMHKWAYCYRTSTEANTNMSLENFHRVLKTIYFHRKRNKRVDHLLSVLLKIARDKAYEAWEKLEKGKRTSKIRDIDKRHKTSLELSLKEVSAANATQWIFPSTANENKLKHSVIKNDYYCECKMKCSSCKVCVHQYSCSCADYAIHSVPCKHIHAIHSNFFENDKQGVQNYGAEENEDVTEKRQYFQHQLNKTDKITDLAFIKESIQGKMNILSNKVEICSVPDALEAAHEHLKNAIAVLDGISSLNSNQQSLQQAEVFPHNKHFEKQRKFYSTKQKATKKKRTLTKPSIEDTNNVKENLKQQEVRLCGICFRENDTTNEGMVEWVECASCEVWIHCACDKQNVNSEEYCCPLCK
ncbi:uncharacterized protein LOC135696369 [Rhopilema esculentum]|uniref:uncharacterized protein LOC135696369 n=1 Tax=Rhopilema esculentum TaxID=499914 RepID=UPI0031E1F972|eukprot:gene12386-3045_t